MNLKQYLEDKRNIINDEIQKILVAQGNHPLREIFAYSLTDGKRFRPILVTASAEACGMDGRLALPASIAIEMIHNFSLIHDDLPCMDNDDYRRGKETCHKKFGETNALLTGDALMIFAFNILAGNNRNGSIPAESLLRTVSIFSEAAGHAGMTGGQVLDMNYQGKTAITREALMEIHTKKTGALITASTMAGGVIAGASEEMIDRLKQYGEKIGFTYQIIDDLLDMDTDPGSISFPAVFGVEESRRIAEESTNEAIRALDIFDHKGDPLRKIAEYLLNRKK